MGRSFPGINQRVTCFLTQRLSWWLGGSLPRIYTPPSPGSSSLAECMNCTRLSDMSERLITLEAKVRQTGEPGPGELAVGRVPQAPAGCGSGCGSASGTPPGLSSLVPGVGCYSLGRCGWPSVGWASLLGWGKGVERARNLKVPGSRLVWVQALGAEGLDA